MACLTLTTQAGTAQTRISTVAGGGPPAGARGIDISVGSPAGLAFDATGNLYIASSQNRVYQMSPGGTVTTVAGIGIPGFAGDGGPATSALVDHPYGVAVRGGTVYFSEPNNNVVRRISNGVISTVTTLASQPSGLAVDSAGNLYVADTGNNRILKVSGGVVTTVAIGASLNAPSGVAVDGGGNL